MNILTRSQRFANFAIILFALHISSASLAADVVQLPPVNLGGTAFLDGIAGPGTLLQITGDHFGADRFKNYRGQSLPGDNEIEVNVLLAQYGYISNNKILGGYTGVEILLPLVNLNPKTSLPGLPDNNESGIGDLIVSPFLLQWTDSTLFRKRFFHRLNFVFKIPSGSYDQEKATNTGTNVYSFNPYYAGTLLWTDKFASSFRLHYLWNSKNKDPNVALGASDTQPGSAVHMNFATSYQITPKLRLGVAGYYLEQLRSDRIDSVSQPNSKEQVFAIGPGLQYRHQRGLFDLNGFFESNVENRPQGFRLVARYSWIY
jgi:hypothetical protein